MPIWYPLNQNRVKSSVIKSIRDNSLPSMFLIKILSRFCTMKISHVRESVGHSFNQWVYSEKIKELNRMINATQKEVNCGEETYFYVRNHLLIWNTRCPKNVRSFFGGPTCWCWIRIRFGIKGFYIRSEICIRFYNCN